MNTPNLPPRSLALAGSVFHSSSRTAIAMNRDQATGLAEERLTTSRLEMAWVGGEVRIRCTATSAVMEPRLRRRR